MNLFFGGQLASLMRPHFFRKIFPTNILRSMVRQNVLCKYRMHTKDGLYATDILRCGSSYIGKYIETFI